jgi:hypothetical protein
MRNVLLLIALFAMSAASAASTNVLVEFRNNQYVIIPNCEVRGADEVLVSNLKRGALLKVRFNDQFVRCRILEIERL